MLVDELKKLTSNSKQYQKEYEKIVRKLKEAASSGLNEITIVNMSNGVKIMLEKEGLTIIHKCELAFGEPMGYDIIKW